MTTNSLVNLTPHAITVAHAGGTLSIAPTAPAARVTSTPGTVNPVSFGEVSIPVATPTVFGAVENLPPPVEGVFYIVSALVGAALNGTRSDVVMPGTGPNDGAIRFAEDCAEGKKGQIQAVTRLIRA